MPKGVGYGGKGAAKKGIPGKRSKLGGKRGRKRSHKRRRR